VLSHLRRHLTYANVVATLALFFALSTGGAFAASKLLTGKQIKNGTVTANDLAKSSVTSKQLKNGTVARADLAPGVATSGPTGPKGDTGAQGPAGPAGSSGATPADGSITTAKLADGAVTGANVADLTITTDDVAANSLTTANLKGADFSGTISLSAGAIANSSCHDYTLSIPGAAVAEAVLISLVGAAPEGMVFQGVRVATEGTALMKVCNFTGGTSPTVNGLAVRIITFG
jgi:hypothetical protein